MKKKGKKHTHYTLGNFVVFKTLYGRKMSKFDHLKSFPRPPHIYLLTLYILTFSKHKSKKWWNDPQTHSTRWGLLKSCILRSEHLVMKQIIYNIASKIQDTSCFSFRLPEWSWSPLRRHRDLCAKLQHSRAHRTPWPISTR